MSRRQTWEEIYRRFDPFRPAENPSWRAERPRSPANDLIRLVAMPFGDARALVTGTIGTGKSTELLRIAEARSSQDLVVVLDLQRHFSQVVGDENALRNIEAWEVVFLGALAVVRMANEILPYSIPQHLLDDLARAWDKAAQATDTPRSAGLQLDAAALAKAMIVIVSAAIPTLGATASTIAATGVGLKVLETAAGGLRWNVPIGQAKKQKADQDTEMQSLLHAVNAIIGYVQSKTSRILLMIDGLDRIADLDRAEALFLRSEMIAQLECRMIVTGPFSLRSHPAAGAIPRFRTILPLVNEPVMRKDDPAKPGPGVPFFCDLYRRRVQDLKAEGLIPQEILERLAYYSGGRARDFVKSIRVVAEQAWLDDVSTIDLNLANRVIDEARRLLETGLDEAHIDVLEHIMQNPLHRLPGDGKARDLLTYGHLLPYCNESEWYYPHPLLLMHLLKPRNTSHVTPSQLGPQGDHSRLRMS